MKPPLRILYLEDDPNDAELVRETLAAEGISCELTRVETEPAFVAALQKGGIDLVLADYTLPSFDGLSALSIVQKHWPHVPVIFVSGTLGEELAIEALKIGATDYVVKTRLSRIVPSVKRALREAEEHVELSQAQEALRRSEAYLAEAQRLSHTGSFGWDFAGGKIYWSQETFRIFDYDPATEPTLERALNRTHPEDRALVRQAIDRIWRERKDFDYEHRLLMPDGSVKHLRVVGRPSKTESGSIEFVGAVTDITERRRAEEELHEAQAELTHVSRVTTLGELTASISHEINQPLAAVVNNANAGLRWLSGDSPDIAEAIQAIQHIVRDGKRASDVILRMRALFKKAPTAKERFDINEAIEEVILLTRSEAQRNRVTVRIELAKDLPLIFGDKIQLQQVMLNLFINAIEAMSATEGGQRQLSVSSQKTAKPPTEADDKTGEPLTPCADWTYVLISVRDSGPGFTLKSQDHLFDAFYTTKPKGLGMGLAISRSIIQAHGGRLQAAPNDGSGVTFWFTLPSIAAAKGEGGQRDQ